MNWIEDTESGILEELEYFSEQYPEYNFTVMKNENGQYAIFNNGVQYTEPFNSLDSDVIEGGIFNDCIIVRSTEGYNIIYLGNGCTVLPYWVEDLDLDGYNPQICDGDYVGYVETSEGVLMEGGIGKSWWKFNWNNNTCTPNLYKELFDDLSHDGGLNKDTIEIGNYLYNNNIDLFNKFVACYIEH